MSVGVSLRYLCKRNLDSLFIRNSSRHPTFPRPVRAISVFRPAFAVEKSKKKATGANLPIWGQGKLLMLRKDGTRHCFHPGASHLDRDSVDVKREEVKSKEMVKVLFSYIWPKDNPGVKVRVLTAMGLLVGAKVVNVQVPFIFKEAINYLNEHTGDVLAFSDPASAVTATAVSIMIGYGVARAGASGLNELRNAVFAKVAQKSIRRIACNVFMHLHNLSLDFHLNRQTGALSKAIDRGSRGINQVMNALVFNIVPTIFEVGLVSSILAYKCGWQFAAVTVASIAAYAAFTLSVTQWRTVIRQQMNRAENEASNRAVDSLINYETVKYFNNEQHELEQYDRHLQKYEKASLKTTTSLAFLNWGQNAILSAALSTVMVMAAKQIMAGTLTVGDLVMVNGLLFQLSVPLNFLGSVYREMRQSLIDMQTLFAIMKIPVTIQNKVDAVPLQVTPQESSIEFRNVCFHYDQGSPILQNLSFTVPSGKKVALVGGSGSGKSTIVRLLYRFYEPKSGEILVNGQDITDVDMASLRAAIGVVPQDLVLFNDTIEYNLKYADFDATKERIEEATRMAGLHEHIISTVNGYQSRVGERGLKLSGGEKQRMAIARAIIKNPPILVFDEATSSLDSILEQGILEALDKATVGRTSICIAHRMSTIMYTDHIIVLDKGRVCEEGTHEELLKLNGLYSRLWNTQQNAFGNNM